MADMIGCFILGGVLLLIGYFGCKVSYWLFCGERNIKKDFPKVDVEIVSLDKSFSDGLYVTPTVRYYYNGKEYIAHKNGYGGRYAQRLIKARSHNQKLKGFVDPKNPEVIFLNSGTLSFFSIILLFLSLGFFAGAINIFITTFIKFMSFLR